jgi:hypothetical protein
MNNVQQPTTVKLSNLATLRVVNEIIFMTFQPAFFQNFLRIKRHFHNRMNIFTSIFIAID